MFKSAGCQPAQGPLCHRCFSSIQVKPTACYLTIVLRLLTFVQIGVRQGLQTSGLAKIVDFLAQNPPSQVFRVFNLKTSKRPHPPSKPQMDLQSGSIEAFRAFVVGTSAVAASARQQASKHLQVVFSLKARQCV
jgi:hypothetical protein